MDLINNAINKAKQTAKGVADPKKLLPTDPVAAYKQKVNEKLGDIASISADANRIAKLPTVKDPRLLKQELEAEIQARISLLEEQKQKVQDEVAEGLKKALELYFMFALRSFPIPKLPIIDPKTLAWLAYLRVKNEIMQLKQLVSRENLKKSKEKFTYPISKKVSDIKAIKPPSFKDIPKIP